MKSILSRLSSLLFCLLFANSVYATEIITSDVGSWGAYGGFQTCYGYSGARACVSNGTYFSGDGVGSGDVVFAYSSSYYIYNTFNIPLNFSGSTMYLSLDMMTGPRNSEQGNKNEYVIITIQQKNGSGQLVQTNTINETISNTTMDTYDYTVTRHSSATQVYIQISGRDGGYWAGNYGAVIGAGTITLNDVGPSTPAYSSAPTSVQLQKRTDTRNITGSGIYIQQSGDNLDLDIQQHGQNNLIAGTSTTSNNLVDATVTGDYNTVNVTQGSATNSSDDNVLLFGINGNHNSMTVSQGDASGDTGGHRAIIDVTGGYNTIGLTQYNLGFGNGQFADINVNGNSNTVSSTQRETDKMLFVDVNGNSNSITTDQKDSGNHFLDITVTNNQTVNATQQGTGDHAATIDLSGYSSTLQLNQNSSTDQVYSIQQNCLTVSGCGTTTVNQQ